MAIKPVVRYMLLCDDWHSDPANGWRVTIIGLLTNINPAYETSYPLVYPELCVFLVLTEGYGQGEGRIVCIDEESGNAVFETGSRPIPFGPDPLKVIGVPFRIQECPFPGAGLYSVQFWYESELVEERPLRVR